ncbi:MAG: hypothetical protein JSR36_15200 [Proteobacteria bacterium]|nr:hypothetical protein [Pseudomonadota bacterium]
MAILAAHLAASDLAQAASAARTVSIVASPATASQLAQLSRRNDVIADVITVDRREVRVRLDGSGGDGLSGRDLDLDPAQAGSAAVTHVSLDEVALVYYAPAGSAEALSTPLIRGSYPSLARVGPQEQALDCAGLDLEIARAGAIRWYARVHGATGFTPKQATGQHVHNGLVDFGVGVAVTLIVIGGGGVPWVGPHSGSTAPAPISMEAWQWAVTAADHRELGLLQLKRARGCPGRSSAAGAPTDLEVLAHVESAQADRAAGRITDPAFGLERVRWLDRLDPARNPEPADGPEQAAAVPQAAAPERAARAWAAERSAAEAAAGFEPLAAPAQPDGSLIVRDIRWFPGMNPLAHWRSLQLESSKALTGTLWITDRSLTVLSEAPGGALTGFGTSIPFDQIAAIENSTFGANSVVVVRRLDGHIDSFQLPGAMNRWRTASLADQVRARIDAHTTMASAH